MSNMTPFEIRLELLKMAKDILIDEYQSRINVINEEWQNEMSRFESYGKLPDHPGLPPYPSELEIIAKAKVLNDFVSGEPKPSEKNP